MFVPSERSFDGFGAPSVIDQVTSVVQQAAPALSIATELLGKSAPEKLAILKARVKNYQGLRTVPPYSLVPGTRWYDAEITKMKAQIGALEKEVAKGDAASADYGVWRQLATAGGVVGLGIGAAVIWFVVSRAQKE